MIAPSVLERTWLFRGVGVRGQRELLARATEREFAKGATLFAAGSEARGLFVILTGVVRVVRERAGRQHVIHTEGPGGTLGEVPIFDGGGYPATAIALDSTRCLVFSPDGIRAAVETDPRVGWIIIQRLAARVRGLVDRLDDQVSRSTASRLAAYLCELPSEAGVINVPLTQTQLAEQLGTVREVVVRDLRRLRDAKTIVSVGRGRISIVDRTGLEAWARGGSR